MFIGGLLYQAVLPRDHCKTLLEKLKSANKSVFGGTMFKFGILQNLTTKVLGNCISGTLDSLTHSAFNNSPPELYFFHMFAAND
jgi:hypothetical protein